ncbi:MAG: hypothetical protein EB084_24240 [Proteobacteria bacterium]|nr:hypothetical protein [Pseudomonadota bacterium]
MGPPTPNRVRRHAAAGRAGRPSSPLPRPRDRRKPLARRGPSLWQTPWGSRSPRCRTPEAPHTSCAASRWGRKPHGQSLRGSGSRGFRGAEPRRRPERHLPGARRPIRDGAIGDAKVFVKKVLRLVAIYNTEARRYHAYLTNVPPGDLVAADIGVIYGARWQVELIFKQLKSNYRIE